MSHDRCTVDDKGNIVPCTAFQHVESASEKGLTFEQLERNGVLAIAPVIFGEKRKWARVRFCPFCGVEYDKEEAA